MSNSPRIKTHKPRLASSSPQGWKPDSQRGSRHDRGYGWKWEKTRERVLHRDKGICQVHKARGELARADQVDHIMSKAEARSLGWTDEQIEDDSNLQAICDACHKAKTAVESQRGAG